MEPTLTLLTALLAASCGSREEAADAPPSPVKTGVRITVDPYCLRSIRGISELKRETYFAICDDGRGFDRRVKDPQRYDDLIETNGITFGRALGLVNGLDRWYKAIGEDPARPGFADLDYLKTRLAPHVREPGEGFRQDMGGRLDVALHGNHNEFPEFMGAYMTDAAARDKKPERLPENIEAAAELAAATLRWKYTDFDRPAYYEPRRLREVTR